MPRPPRVQAIGYPMHVVVRGVDRRDCFVDDGDRSRFVRWMFEYADRSGCQIHAFVLMSNHVHLLLTGLRNGAISKAMQCLGRRYVRYFNHRHGRTGTLFEGRFRASLVATDTYVIACIRYIDLNPLRAGMVTDPTAYPWSSCRLHARPAQQPGWVPHPCYVALGSDDATRARAYRELLAAPLPGAVLDSIRTGARRGRPVGSGVVVELRPPVALGSVALGSE